MPTDINYPPAGVANPNWRDPVLDVGSLPTINNNVGDVRLTKDTYSLYGWDGASWVLLTAGGGGGGTITQIDSGFGILLTPDPITTTGSVALDAVNSNGFLQNIGGVLSFTPIGGSDIVLAVRFATTAALAGAPVYANGLLGVGATLTRGSNGAFPTTDGVVPILGDLVLVKNQASTFQNGVYEITTLGSAGAPWVLTRTTSSDEDTEFDGQQVSVSSGTVSAGKTYAQQTDLPITVGTTAIVYAVTIAGNLVTQAAAGSQALYQIPSWAGTARRLSKGTSGFMHNESTEALTINSKVYNFPAAYGTGSLNYALVDVAGNGTLVWAPMGTGFTFDGSGNQYAAVNLTLTTSTYNYITSVYTSPVNLIADSCVFIGSDVGFSSNGLIGCTYIGTGSGVSATTAQYDIGIGLSAQALMVDGGYNVVIGSGSTGPHAIWNTYLGYGVGNGNLGNYNFFLGGNSGIASSVDGLANFNICVGVQSGVGSPSDLNATMAFGSFSYASQSNQAVFGASYDSGGGAVGNITEAYFGAGVRDLLLPTNDTFTFRVTGPSTVAVSDQDGMTMRFAAGIGVGTTVSGGFSWLTSDPTTSGSYQTESEKMFLTNAGTFGTFLDFDLSGDSGTIGQVLTSGGSGAPAFWSSIVPGSGTVTSVDLSMPGIFSVSGNPVTASGTLAVDFTTQTANTVFSGPTTGVAATPTFRSLVAADIPNIGITNTITALDSTFTIVDDGDNTKKLAWQVSGVSAATTRTITALNISGTDVLSNGALTATRIPVWTASGLADYANLVWDNTNNQLTLGGNGTAALPAISVGGTTNGMYLSTTNTLGWSTNGVVRMTLSSSSLNVSGADLVKGGFTAGGNNISTSQQIVAGHSNTNTIQYRTTNGGSDLTLSGLFSTSVSSAGVVSIIADKNNGNGLTLGAANGTRIIARAAMTIINLTNTAGSEAADLSFLTQSAGAAMASRMVITHDGRIYGTGIHNNAGAVTGTTNQYMASGTYTPTLTNTTNVAASTAAVCQWIRVGNVVTVSGQVDIDITTTLLASDMGMSLPIASNFASATQCGGTAISDADATCNIRIKGDATNDRAQFVWSGQASVANNSYNFSFTYLVV